MSAIAITGLKKRYEKLEALRGIDLEIPAGLLFGLIGPNGAGKSTLMKAIVGAMRPTAGSVTINGLDPLKDRVEVRRLIGYMPQSAALYEDLTARANVEFFASAHDVSDLDRRVTDVLAFTDLAERANDRVHTFSGGMKRRVSLACALVHEPSILFLDEPTAAVDPELRATFWKTFRELASAGKTLFISTHLMDEALLCDRLAVIRAGKIIADETPRQLLERGKTTLVVQRGDDVDRVMIRGTSVELAGALQKYGVDPAITHVGVERESLEEIVLDLIRAADAGAQ
jgi:ABC-2 type transport system ATP-binding protein